MRHLLRSYALEWIKSKSSNLIKYIQIPIHVGNRSKLKTFNNLVGYNESLSKLN